MAVPQSTYSSRMNVAVAGMPADMRNFDGISRNVETAAGIAFGVAVGRGDTSAEKGCKVGGALTDFLGVTYKDVTVEAAASNPDKYIQNTECGIMTQGTCWVKVTGTPGPDDAVHYDATTGVFAASGGNGPVVGARFISTTVTAFGQALCKLHLGGNNQAAA